MARNALALYAAQGARYLIPLALVPFLARVLRPEAFGRLAFAQSLASLLAVVVDFGFIYSATREIARRRERSGTHREIAAGVLGARVLLAAVLALVSAAMIAVVPGLRELASFVWGAWFLAVTQASSPAWYFQGVERMGLQTGIEVLGSAVGAGFLFAVIRVPAQAAWVLFVMGAGALGAAIVNHVRLYRCVPFERPRLGSALRMIHQSLALFFLRVSITLYTGANAFLLGLFVPAAVVADFAGAEKVVRASLSLFSPVAQALFPRMSHLLVHDRRRGIRIAKLLLGGFAAVAGAGAGLLAWVAPWVVHLLLGPGYENAVQLLRWLVVLLPLIAISNVLAFQIMLPLGMDRATNVILGGAAVMNVVAIALLVPRFGAMGMVWSVIVSETAVTGGLALHLALRRSAARRLTAAQGTDP